MRDIKLEKRRGFVGWSKDGVKQLCPFNEIECGSHCPHFRYGDNQIRISCSGCIITIAPIDIEWVE